MTCRPEPRLATARRARMGKCRHRACPRRRPQPAPAMPLSPRAFLAALLLAGLASPAAAVPPLRQHDVVLLQKGEVIAQRVDGGADALAAYLKRLGTAATEAMRANPQQIPAAGFIAVAIRPGGQSHTWFDFKPALAEASTRALTQAVESVAPPTVREAPVVFALRVSIWSDKPPLAYAPAPQEWRDAATAAGHKLDIDSLIAQVWPR